MVRVGVEDGETTFIADFAHLRGGPDGPISDSLLGQSLSLIALTARRAFPHRV